MQETQLMSRDVTIQILDVSSASGAKTIYQNEPFVLRSSGAIRQVKNGTTNLTNALNRVGVGTITEGYNDDNDLLTEPSIIQLATVEDVQAVYDEVTDASQGFIDVTVKHCFRFEAFTNAPYNVKPVLLSSPDASALVAGDLAIAPYWNIGSFNQSSSYDGFVSREFFSDAGNRNGISPTTSSPLTGAGFPLYRYDGIGWLPAVFDNSNTLKKYRIKVLKDQTYYFQTFPNQIANAFESVYLENYYYLVYMPSSAVTEIVRTAQFLKVSQTDARVINFDCGDTSAPL